MFSIIVQVLQFVEKDDRDWKNRDQASNLLVNFKSFDFGPVRFAEKTSQNIVPIDLL